MGMHLRILKAVHPDGGGARPKRLLEAMGRTPREKARAKKVVAQMIASGDLVMYGRRKGAKYGLPGQPPARKSRRRRKAAA